MTSINHPNNLCYVTLHFPSSTSCHCPDHVPLRELGKKFDENKKCEITSNNNPTIILNNLCSGLETFLGFNSTSKGYDGSGIVYSDLDRLCDGVMGFLYQVLKDVSEKQPYSVGKEELKKLVTDLKTKLSTGREGFKVIAQVARKVREYNERVKESNNHVKTIINNMDRDMKTLQNEVGKILQHNPDSDDLNEVKQAETLVTKLADEYAKKGMNFDSNFVIREMNAWRTGAKVEPIQQFKDINSDLRLKITHARNNITHEAERLTTLSKKQKENLAAMTSMISNKLKTLKSCVNERILKDVNELVKELNDKVGIILEQLVMIRQKLQGYVEKLRRWIRDADEIVTDCMKTAENIEKKHVAWAAEDEIKKSLKEINKSFGEAKDFVKQELNNALGKVRDMDEAIKKDLFAVKGKIKEAVKALGKTLEENVKDGLWAIEQKITKPLDEVVRNSGQFFEDFKKTRNALQAAIGIVMEDILNLGGLKVNESIKNAYGDTTIKAPLLQVIGQGMAFSKLKTYFNQLDTDVMQKIKEAMRQISEGMESIAGNAFRVDLESCINKARSQLVALHSIAENPEKVFQSATLQKNLRRYLGDKMTIAPLNGKFSGLSTAIKAVTTDLAGASSIDASKLKNDLKSLLSELGNIAQIVSSHSADIVKTVIEAIVRQLTTEIGNVSDAIKDKVDKIRDAITYNRDNNEVDYGAQEKAKGLLKLQNVYGTDINERLKTLQGTVTNEAFKHTYSQPRSKENYEFGGTFMEEFKTTYEKNLKDGDFKADGGESVLDQEIGPNNLPNGGSSGDKISSVAKSNFTHYEQHVKQESLAHSNPQKLEGALPTAIKDIRDYGLQLFEQKLGAKEDRNTTKFDGFLDDITKSISGLMQALERTGKSLNVALGKLKNEKIGMTTSGAAARSDTLQELEKNLLQLFGVDLDQVIKDATAFKQQANQLRDKTIRDLNGHVEDEVKKAETALITQANKNYVTSVKDMLQAFADKVQKELKPLPGEIDTDRKHGFKGFMRTW
ncbi:hypothetical protein, conserved, partial [Babesia bigemina]